jgi:hypothetical protein
MRKLLAVVLLGLAFGAHGSPAQSEKLEFCKTVAGNYKAGADAKKLGMPQDELEGRLMVFIMGLMNAGMPEPMIKLHVQAVIDGYVGKSSAEKHFEGCMTTEMI